jgi:hypothetical protein
MRIARGNDKPHGMQAGQHQANNTTVSTTTVLDVIAMYNQSQYNKGENGENN